MSGKYAAFFDWQIPVDSPFVFQDEQGLTWASYHDYVLSGLLHLCICCRSDDLAEDVLDVLDAYGTAPDGYVSFRDLPVSGPEKYAELILHLLDRARLIEHGGSIRGSWLNDDGKDVVGKLRAERERAAAHKGAE